MFGLSLTKIFLTIFVIVADWYGWRQFARFQALRATRDRAEEVPKNDPRATTHARAHDSPDSGRAGESPRAYQDAPQSGRSGAEDMIECRTCGAFIAARRRVACGRKDCPYPG